MSFRSDLGETMVSKGPDEGPFLVTRFGRRLTHPGFRGPKGTFQRPRGHGGRTCR